MAGSARKTSVVADLSPVGRRGHAPSSRVWSTRADIRGAMEHVAGYISDVAVPLEPQTADLPTDSAFAVFGCTTLPSLAHDIRDDLRRDAPWQDTLRLIIAASDDFASLTRDSERAFFLQEPSTTSDARYDAFLAALAVHLCRGAGLSRTPDWTRDADRYLPSFWWYGAAEEGTGLRAYAWQRTPSCFRARGVVFNIDNLASV
ncbi:MAG: hypothetical protein QG597_2505 [Actinomycetota bacterium]|nr:hypothetical protein [Actinomycetota bacterium]